MEAESGAAAFPSFCTSFCGVFGNELRESVAAAGAIIGMFEVETEVAPGVFTFDAPSREAFSVTGTICVPDVELLCRLASGLVSLDGDGLGVSKLFTARSNESLPFKPESGLGVGICISAAPVVPKVCAIGLAAITLRTEEANEMPDVAEANVELAAGVGFSLVPVVFKVPAVGLAVLTFRTEGADETSDVAETSVGVGARGALGPKEALPFELGSETAAGVCFSIPAVVAKVPPALPALDVTFMPFAVDRDVALDELSVLGDI